MLGQLKQPNHRRSHWVQKATNPLRSNYYEDDSPRSNVRKSEWIGPSRSPGKMSISRNYVQNSFCLLNLIPEFLCKQWMLVMEHPRQQSSSKNQQRSDGQELTESVSFINIRSTANSAQTCHLSCKLSLLTPQSPQKRKGVSKEGGGL